MDEFLPLEVEEPLKCRKHPSHDGRGVCPFCLKSRLALLCPDCRHIRPCNCGSSSSAASVSASSSASNSSIGRPSVSEIGTVGKISALIDSEPSFQRSRSAAFQRSRSAALQFVRSRSVAAVPRPPENRKRPSLFSFFKAEKPTKEAPAAERVSQSSRSAGIPRCSDAGEGSDGDVRLKGRGWYFPSPIRVFRQRKSAMIIQARSPLCRG
ncbi:hypothetical protein QJS10_CPA01g02922 [Acorus calamus]|uniref:Uncharacterized protein n=1 Tax=Acorus calamus TaxID=4465 RepID=A0AAV9FGE3_ACOCL|nr:hypothetical protein QJS10_CPA01g02922 [Acorus calamus]